MSASSHSSAQALDVLIVDLQGNLRGKRLPAEMAAKALECGTDGSAPGGSRDGTRDGSLGGTRLPLSTQLLDIWGDDCDHITQTALSQGDPDGVCIPLLSTLKEVPWRASVDGTQQVLASLCHDDGTPSSYDPRAQLAAMDNKLKHSGLTAVVAVELEFYVMDASTHETAVPIPPRQLKLAGDAKELQLYDLRVRDRLEPLIDRIERYAKAMDIPVTTSLLEFGPGQVEINLAHRKTALAAADDAVMFKRLVDRAAFEEGFFTTFMAKPYTEAPGSGMHCHLSLIDEDGNAVFDGSDKLLHSCAGVLKHLPDMLVMFAPHMNSWRRLQPDSFAPTRLDWGYDHRGVAIRIPETNGKGARLEQRIAGADANPYHVLTLLIAAVMDGLKLGEMPSRAALAPGEPQSAPHFTHDWITAIESFQQSNFTKEAFGEDYQQLYAKIKRHEAAKLMAHVSNIDWQTYLPQL